MKRIYPKRYTLYDVILHDVFETKKLSRLRTTNSLVVAGSGRWEGCGYKSEPSDRTGMCFGCVDGCELCIFLMLQNAHKYMHTYTEMNTCKGSE